MIVESPLNSHKLMLRNTEMLKKDPVKKKKGLGSNGTNLKVGIKNMKVGIKKTNVAQN